MATAHARPHHTFLRERHVGLPSWYAVAVLFLVSVFNFMDRQLLAILLEPIKRDLGASDTVMGLLTGFAFVLFFALASVPIARAADVRSRRNIIAGALAFWSVMTMLSGLATSFVQLAAARVGLGLGEAATSPAGQSMISDLFSRTRRTAPLSVLAVAAPVGFMVAFVLGGYLNQAIGWRMTFVALGAPGLLLAIIVMMTVREPRRGGTEDGGWIDEGRYEFHDAISYLSSLRSLRWLVAGAALNVFAAWAALVWSASFLIRVHGLDTSAAGAALGFGIGVGGAVGTFLGGLAAGYLGRRDTRWLLWIPALTSLLAVPFLVLFLSVPVAAAPAMYFGTALFGPSMLGPVMSVTQGLAKVRMRALAAALTAMAFNLFGAGLGPLTVGVLSDYLSPDFGPESIRYALLFPVTVALLGAAICFFRGASHVRNELNRVA